MGFSSLRPLGAGLAVAVALVAGLSAASGAAAAEPAVKLPTKAVCPGSFGMSGTNVVVVSFALYNPSSSKYHWKCVWGPDAAKPADEWFVVFIDVVPPNVPGSIESGDCAKTHAPTDLLKSEKRYLTIGGGTRNGLHPDEGDLAIFKQTLAMAEGQQVGLACATTATSPKPATTPTGSSRMPTLDDLHRNKEYRTFFGLDDPATSLTSWIAQGVRRCGEVVDRAKAYPGVTSEAEIPGESTFGKHSASIVFGKSDFHDLLDSSASPSNLPNNVFVEATKRYEARLRATIVNSRGNLEPADVVALALRATNGSYPLAVLTALNVLKNVTFEGREAATAAEALTKTNPAGVAAQAKARELYDGHIAALRSANQVVSKLVSLRRDPQDSHDKMGPWYHAFTILTVGAVYTVPIPKGTAAAFWEHGRKALGWFGESEAKFNPEKASLDTCFAIATDSPDLRAISR